VDGAYVFESVLGLPAGWPTHVIAHHFFLIGYYYNNINDNPTYSMALHKLRRNTL
jgi:hypothetical protein